jgi:hypothetical protein
MPRERVTLIPVLLECVRTQGEGITEEPYLCLYQDERRVTSLGSFRMQSGGTQQLGNYPLVGEQVGILLSEDDYDSRWESYDDHLGGLQVLGALLPGFGTTEEYGLDRMSHVERKPRMRATATLRELDFTRDMEYSSHQTGFHYVQLPYHEGSYDHEERRYRLYFYLIAHEDDELPQPPYCLELVSLECENAQEWKDYPYIKVNGQNVWGPYRMRDSGDAATRSIDVEPVAIYDVTSIMLWEEDSTTRDDLFGEFELRIEEDFQFNHLYHYAYTPDHSIYGDARYTLSYRVRQRTMDLDGNYLRCPGRT